MRARCIANMIYFFLLYTLNIFIFLGNSEGPRPEWFRTPNTLEQEAISPVQTSSRSHPEHHHEIEEINPAYILPDGSITEVTEYTDLMCKSGKETEFYIVSKYFPTRGYSLVQNFRKVHDTDLGIDTYIRGECIEYKTVDPSCFQDRVKPNASLEEVLASFHIQKNLASRIMLLSKPLKKGKNGTNSDNQMNELENQPHVRR